MTDLADIRAAYESSIPDAYASPAWRKQHWEIIAELIDEYAAGRSHAYADSLSSPTIDSNPATELSEPDKPSPAAPPRPTATRKARP